MGEKMNREDLKTLIKECLVEILTEGSSRPQPRPRVNESPVRAVVQDIPRRKTIGGMSLDRPAIPRQQTSQPAPARAVASESIKRITSDPMMASIFADTAATTLQEQIQAENMRPGTAADPFAAAAARIDPTDAFGDAAQNWAALAFSAPVNR
jgi:hypothetical protein